MACPRHNRATAFGVAHGKSHLRPFPKWHVSAFPHLGYPLSLPFRHHRSTTAPSIHRTVLLAQVDTTSPLPSFRDVGATSSPTPCRGLALATSSDQRKQAGHARGGQRAIREAGRSLHTPPRSYQRSGSGLAWTRTPQVWIAHAHFIANPSRDFLLMTDGRGLESKSLNVFIWYVILHVILIFTSPHPCSFPAATWPLPSVF